MRKKIIAGNWKMNGQTSSINTLLDELKELTPNTENSINIIFPPAIYLQQVKEALSATSFKWGGQNTYPQDKGAYTGEISTVMLRDMGCQYVLVGHSERRHIFAENEKIIAEKFHHVKEHGMIPIVCIGETLEQREQGQTESILKSQLLSLVEADSRCFNNSVIAYEPVWAIGTGKTAYPEQIGEVHQYIRNLVASVNKEDAESTAIIYGGSVTEKNASALLASADIDGVLVGGASLNAQQFVEIITCIN